MNDFECLVYYYDKEKDAYCYELSDFDCATKGTLFLVKTKIKSLLKAFNNDESVDRNNMDHNEAILSFNVIFEESESQDNIDLRLQVFLHKDFEDDKYAPVLSDLGKSLCDIVIEDMNAFFSDEEKVAELLEELKEEGEEF